MLTLFWDVAAIAKSTVMQQHNWKPGHSYVFWIFTNLDNKTEINLTWILAEIFTVKSVDCGPFRLAHGAPFGSIQLFQYVSIVAYFSAF